MLGAVTDDESARTFRFPDQFGTVRVAPRTTYGVTRLQQEFGSGSSTALMGTAVHRELGDTDPLASLLTRNAFTVSSDSLIRLADGAYELQLNAGVAHVAGEAGAIDRLQRSSARYLHRPDADYLSYDPLRTSMTGMKVVANLERRNARHWLWQAGVETETPEFETNDLGRLSSGDNIGLDSQIEYRETRPGRWLRNYSVSLSPQGAWNYGGDLQEVEIEPSARLTWRNFWQTNLSGSIRPRSQNMRLTRGGPSMEQPAGWQAEVGVESSDASETRGETSFTYGRNEDGGLTFQLDGEITMQPAPQWQLSISPEYERLVDTQQYVSTLAGGGPATFGGRYIFADVDRSTYATQFRLTYTFKPDLTLDFYGEPFSASGRYDRIGELAAARTRLRRVYGTDGTTVTTAGRRQSAGHRRRDQLHAAQPRLQRAVLPQQPRATLGMAPRQHAVPRVAAGSVGGGDAARAHVGRRHVQLVRTPRRSFLRHQDQLLVLTRGSPVGSRFLAVPGSRSSRPAPAPASAFAQAGQNGRQRADAVRVADGAIRVDGRLDDAAWQAAPPLTDFLQKEPDEGAAPSDRMEVRFAYDEGALYVGARMFAGAPIQAPMGRRDEGDQAEHFGVYLDTYLDRRTASAFGVTAAGVRLDEYFASDNDEGESDFDPVWLARTSVDPQGWTAELRIPFAQLRFTDQDQQVWGLNIKRWVPSRNEEVHWTLIRRTEEGFASRFGDLHGITGIRPSRRIELLPYVASSSHLFGDPEPGNPFTDSADIDGRLGLDAKVGIGSNLTLEATVNPDFGQVEADPAEVNLSAFETFFDERRPFFLEGSQPAEQPGRQLVLHAAGSARRRPGARPATSWTFPRRPPSSAPRS